MRIVANVAKVDKYSLRVINSLIHGGPYVAIHVGKQRVAWVSFKTRKHTVYDTSTKQDMDRIHLVDEWFGITENYNLAAAKWNSLDNGVKVSLV